MWVAVRKKEKECVYLTADTSLFHVIDLLCHLFLFIFTLFGAWKTANMIDEPVGVHYTPPPTTSIHPHCWVASGITNSGTFLCRLWQSSNVLCLWNMSNIDFLLPSILFLPFMQPNRKTAPLLMKLCFHDSPMAQSTENILCFHVKTSQIQYTNYSFLLFSYAFLWVLLQSGKNSSYYYMFDLSLKFK